MSNASSFMYVRLYYYSCSLSLCYIPLADAFVQSNVQEVYLNSFSSLTKHFDRRSSFQNIQAAALTNAFNCANHISFYKFVLVLRVF